MSRSITTAEGIDIAYRVVGDGPSPVLLLHSLALDGSWFEPMAEALGAEFRCVIPDLRGHGASGGGSESINLAHPNRGCRSWGLKPPVSSRLRAM